MTTVQWAFLNSDDKAMGTDGWNAEHDDQPTITYTGLWRGDEVVALLVTAENIDDAVPVLRRNGNLIVTACNAHDQLVAALQKIIEMNVQYCVEKYGDALKAESMACVTTARAALAAAGVAL